MVKAEANYTPGLPLKRNIYYTICNYCNGLIYLHNSSVSVVCEVLNNELLNMIQGINVWTVLQYATKIFYVYRMKRRDTQ
jgi:hypothetical protein